MASSLSLFGLVFKFLRKFLTHVSGTVVLTMVLGSISVIVLCSAKNFCIEEPISWVILELILAVLGFILGTYNFTKLK